MDTNVHKGENIKQAVPFFMVTEMERSLKFYIGSLGFELKNTWTPRGTIEWCWLQRDAAAIMLQQYRKDGAHEQIDRNLGQGVSICFNALTHWNCTMNFYQKD